MKNFKAYNILLLSVLTCFLICYGCNSDKKYSEPKNVQDAKIAYTDSTKEVYAERYKNDIENVEDTTVSFKILEVQFDDFYQKLHEFTLPVSIDIDVLVEVPESIKMRLFDPFNLARDTISQSSEIGYISLSVAKLPEYKNIKILIVHKFFDSGSDALFLYSLLNYKLIDKLLIENQNATYDNDVVTERTFTITNKYEIKIKDVARWESSGTDMDSLEMELYGWGNYVFRNYGKDVIMGQETYIIDDDGKFVKKP